METKFTEGSWSIKMPKKHKHYAKISGSGWRDFAKIVVQFEGEDYYYEEGLANAKLISAAPDLLDVTLEFIHAIEVIGDLGVYGSTIEKAKNAIKKATE